MMVSPLLRPVRVRSKVWEISPAISMLVSYHLYCLDCSESSASRSPKVPPVQFNVSFVFGVVLFKVGALTVGI